MISIEMDPPVICLKVLGLESSAGNSLQFYKTAVINMLLLTISIMSDNLLQRTTVGAVHCNSTSQACGYHRNSKICQKATLL